MKRKLGKWKFVLIPFGIAAFVAVIGYVVMALWNNLLPEILDVKTITFWQAVGIFVLCKILFGFGGKGGGGKAAWMKGRMSERFKNMTPEEREAFKAQWDERCNWRGRGMGRRPFPFDKDKQNAPAAPQDENVKTPSDERTGL